MWLSVTWKPASRKAARAPLATFTRPTMGTPSMARVHTRWIRRRVGRRRTLGPACTMTGCWRAAILMTAQLGKSGRRSGFSMLGISQGRSRNPEQRPGRARGFPSRGEASGRRPAAPVPTRGRDVARRKQQAVEAVAYHVTDDRQIRRDGGQTAARYSISFIGVTVIIGPGEHPDIEGGNKVRHSGDVDPPGGRHSVRNAGRRAAAKTEFAQGPSPMRSR